ncbi:MAG: protein kinase, partial [Gammaproteobacteria bacterium]|nr:protein kinase [Gammaproteobacteria bacterium]
MPLQPDHAIAHYRIVEKIGEGGMGEVYRAEDTKLGRSVAIKVLPEAFVQDQDRLARFAREAQLLASLNHPNIAAIYGLEETEGATALALELVEGETLAERIQRGPLPVEDTLAVGLQIAEALEAAHDKGIIHRDLKPANI